MIQENQAAPHFRNGCAPNLPAPNRQNPACYAPASKRSSSAGTASMPGALQNPGENGLPKRHHREVSPKHDSGRVLRSVRPNARLRELDLSHRLANETKDNVHDISIRHWWHWSQRRDFGHDWCAQPAGTHTRPCPTCSCSLCGQLFRDSGLIVPQLQQLGEEHQLQQQDFF